MRSLLFPILALLFACGRSSTLDTGDASAPDGGSPDSFVALDATTATPDGAVIDPPPSDCWTWENPSAPSSHFMDVHGTSASDVWVVGGGRAASHWDGESWTTYDTGGGRNLRAVWAVARDDVWAVGEGGVIVHFDGSSWSRVETGTEALLFDVWASGDDVWVVGDEGLVLRRGRDGFRAQDSGTDQRLTSVWGSSSSDVWMVGPGALLHHDGTGIARRATGHGVGALEMVWGISPTDVWIVAQLAVLHWDGRAWEEMDLRGISGSGFRVWGSSADDLWIVGRYAGVTYRRVDDEWRRVTNVASDAFMGLWGAGPNDIWAAGRDGVVSHWDGRRWTLANGLTHESLSDVIVVAPDDVWAVSWDGVFRREGETWSRVGEELRAQIWPTATGAVRVTDRTGTTRDWDGSEWSPVSDAWAGGPMTFANDIHIAEDGRAWAVGGHGTRGILLSRFDGEWMDVDLGDVEGANMNGLNAVWAASDDDIWAAGNRGYAVHWDGESWSETQLDVEDDFHGVSGSGSDDVWMVGINGSIVHWDGAEWQLVVDRWDGVSLHDVWVRNEDDAWAVGAGILHWDGDEWTQVCADPPIWRPILQAVDGTPDGHVWAVGDDGAILSKAPER
ncbi:MAG: hypothetical protein JJ863_04215 [Deltaproteobacteria bacterium]|nr:hypothetical protein [Deltaproteobacteria bacterium]